MNDVNNMVIFISPSERCSMGNDGSMFLKMNLHKKMHIADCLAADGGYTLFIQKFKEISISEGYDFTDKNISCPIRKENKVELTLKKESYNRKFGAFRSGNKTTVIIRFNGLKNKGNSIYGTLFFPPLFFS